MFDPNGFENTRPDGFSVLEVVSDLSRLRGARRFVPLKHTCLSGEITGPLADLRLTQTFLYTARECDQVLEALYRFPLPGDAAVTGVTVRFGDTTIHAELKERDQAEADYEEAKSQGRQATLTKRENPDVFTLHITGLKPDQKVVVETAYVQLARYEGSHWTLRVPLTTAPRYVRGDEGGSRHRLGQPLALLRDPHHRFALNLLFRNSQNMQSKTHALLVEAEAAGQRVHLRGGEVVPNRDCVLSWQAMQTETRPALHLLLHKDAASGQVYFLALIAPPKVVPASGPVPRETILLVDHSGSMAGVKWVATDRTVTRFLESLTPQDMFALGLFHDDTRWFAHRPLTATRENVAASVEFLKRSKDIGGTNLGVALEQALSLQPCAGSRARHVLIVTDAEVSDGGRLLQLATEEAKLAQRRISVICIDAAPNALLANELAERGGGVCRFLTSDPAQEDVKATLDSLLEDWSAPVLHGLRLLVDRPRAEAVEHRVEPHVQGESSWIDIGDLPAGRAVWIAGRVPVGDAPHLSFRLVAGAGPEVASCRCDLNDLEESRPALKALFGAKRVLGLEFLMTACYPPQELRSRLSHLGYDPDKVLIDPKRRWKLYRENLQEDMRPMLRELLAREALDYGLASAETAFIAVGSEIGATRPSKIAIPNALPSGWSPAFGGMACDMKESIASYGACRNCDIDFEEASGGYESDGADTPATVSDSPGIVQQAIRALGNLIRGGNGGAKKVAPMAGMGVVFSGVPAFEHGEAILFESANAANPFWGGCLSELKVTFSEGTHPDLDGDLELLLYLGDLVAPRVCVRLSELMLQGGILPLELLKEKWEGMRVALRDPNGAWETEAPAFTVTLQ